MRNTDATRLDSELAILRNILELLKSGTSRDRVEEELVRRGPVDLDLLGAVIRRLDTTGPAQREAAQ